MPMRSTTTCRSLVGETCDARWLTYPNQYKEGRASMTAVIGDIRTGRSMVSESLFKRLVARIVNDPDVAQVRAELVMDQALAFLGTCAVTDVPMSPTDAVDIGWHTFILHTREYT